MIVSFSGYVHLYYCILSATILFAFSLGVICGLWSLIVAVLGYLLYYCSCKPVTFIDVNMAKQSISRLFRDNRSNSTIGNYSQIAGNNLTSRPT